MIVGSATPGLAEANNSAGGAAGGAFFSSYSPTRLQYQPSPAFGPASTGSVERRRPARVPPRYRR
jgi:hypothetical protein